MPRFHSLPWRGAVGALTAVLLVSACAATEEEEDEATALEGELGVFEVVEPGTELRVTASGLNLRSARTTASRVLTVLRRDTVVRCVEKSGHDGWVRVTRLGRDGQPTGDPGWVYGKYVQRIGDDPRAGDGTCAPDRGEDVVGRYEKALHDTLAYSEGTRGHGQDGYDIIFGYQRAPDCRDHPGRCIPIPNSDKCSSASGRYQFLAGTWREVAERRGFTSFEPENQERAALYRIVNTRRATIPPDRPLTLAEFEVVVAKLSDEWTSLRRKGVSALWLDYCRNAGSCAASD